MLGVVIVFTLWSSASLSHTIFSSGDPPIAGYQAGGVLVRVAGVDCTQGVCVPNLECYGDADTNIIGGIEAGASLPNGFAYDMSAAGKLTTSGLEFKVHGHTDGSAVKESRIAADLHSSVVFRVSGGMTTDFVATLAAGSIGDITVAANESGVAQTVVNISIIASIHQESTTTEVYWHPNGACGQNTFVANAHHTPGHDVLWLGTAVVCDFSGDPWEERVFSLNHPMLTPWLTKVLEGDEDVFQKNMDTRLHCHMVVSVYTGQGTAAIDVDDPLRLELAVYCYDLP